jgi:hypothetical protein
MGYPIDGERLMTPVPFPFPRPVVLSFVPKSPQRLSAVNPTLLHWPSRPGKPHAEVLEDPRDPAVKLLGDGVMAAFGLPRVAEDEAGAYSSFEVPSISESTSSLLLEGLRQYPPRFGKCLL